MSRIQRVLTRVRPGRALTMLARVRVPILRAERIAGQTPEHDHPAASPLVEDVSPVAALPGVLEGAGVVVKDQLDVAGMRTGVGLPDGGDLADRDAAIVARIRAAGGSILGKAKMTELGMDGIGTLMPYAMPPNPRAPGYSPGGSSTGTAVAVASGLARYGVGGDGLGSVRIPAAFCGLVGLKPSRTRLPREGIRSPVRSLDAVGPITRTAEDCARLWQVMAGEPITALTPWLPDHVGVPAFASPVRVARSIRMAFERMLAALAVPVETVALPGFESATFLGGMTGAYELSTGPFAERTQSPNGKMSVALGRSFSSRDVERLVAQRDALKQTTMRVLESHPILAMPTTAIPPPALTPDLVRGKMSVVLLRALGAFTPLANLCDLPAIAVPSGVDERGRPLSIMFVAGLGGEARLLQLALAVERTGLGMTPV
ncbi:MAG: amidase [Myxococcales bacterium]|nr:amidase [Myxococcales bacterium]